MAAHPLFEGVLIARGDRSSPGNPAIPGAHVGRQWPSSSSRVLRDRVQPLTERLCHPGHASGFTLLELLIVLVISALLIGTVVPNFGPGIARAQLYSATRDVASALRHTRGQAMITGQDALFELNTAQHTYRVTGRPKVYQLPGDIELGLFTTSTETVDEGIGRIRFFPDGSATGGRVTLIGAKQTRVVDINWLTGEVRMGDDDSEE